MNTLRSLLMTLGVFSSAGIIAQTRAPEPEPIRWQPCGIEHNPTLECAFHPVPLSYTAPFDGQIGLNLVRQPALDSSLRKGSLFLNPGGPGGSGAEMLVYAGQDLFTPEVRARYDLIGFDPRGTNASTPLGCLQTQEEVALLSNQPAFPVGRHQEWRKIGLDAYLNLSCLTQANRVIHHMSTADVARDMDLLRQAVGDEKLNFYGVSYGSILGMTYANLFPERVGAMVIDGVLDPVSWSTGRGWESFLVPATTRLKSDAGANATLKEFFRLCDQAGPERCALAGNAEDRFARSLAALKERPQLIQLPDGTSFQLDYQGVVATTLRYLYSSYHWPELSRLMADLERTVADEPVEAFDSAFMSRPIAPSNGAIDQHLVRFLGVLCADTDNPRVPFLWAVAADEAEREHGYFGRHWTWAGSACAGWVGSQRDRYAGPYSRQTANTILVVNALFDPATGYEGAASAANILGNARLLTVDGWGHNAAALSGCANHAIAEYFLYSQLPEEGTVCSQDFSPFPETEPVEPPAALAGVSAEEAAGKGFPATPARQQVQAHGVAQSEGEMRKQARERHERILRETLGTLPLGAR